MTSPAGFRLSPQPPPLRALLRDLWASRGLIRLLARKDFIARYRRASLGILWAIGVPLIQAAVIAVIFTRVVRIETEGNYGVFVLSGILPWVFFQSTVSGAAGAIVDGSQLATKIYFPRAALPLVSIGAELYGLVCSMAILLVAGATLGPGLAWRNLLLIPAIVLLVVLSTGFTLALAALQVYFRDIRYILQAVTRAWFYGTPVIYPLDIVPEGLLRFFIELNPMTGVVQLFRASIFPIDPGWTDALWWSLAWLVMALVLAAILHRRFDRLFVDLL